MKPALLLALLPLSADPATVTYRLEAVEWREVTHCHKDMVPRCWTSARIVTAYRWEAE